MSDDQHKINELLVDANKILTGKRSDWIAFLVFLQVILFSIVFILFVHPSSTQTPGATNPDHKIVTNIPSTDTLRKKTASPATTNPSTSSADTTISKNEYYELVSRFTIPMSIDSTNLTDLSLASSFTWRTDGEHFYLSVDNSPTSNYFQKVVYTCLDSSYQTLVTDRDKFTSTWSLSKMNNKFVILLYYKDGRIAAGTLQRNSKSNYFTYLTSK